MVCRHGLAPIERSRKHGLQNVDLSVKLEILTFNLALREHESVGKTACHDMEI